MQVLLQPTCCAIHTSVYLCHKHVRHPTQPHTAAVQQLSWGPSQVRSSELEAELDSVRDEANRRIRQLDSANQEQAALLQQQEAELLSRRKQAADLEGKLQSRSGALADHSQRAKQLQQVRFYLPLAPHSRAAVFQLDPSDIYPQELEQGNRSAGMARVLSLDVHVCLYQ